jgi:hypothetical protein
VSETERQSERHRETETGVATRWTLPARFAPDTQNVNLSTAHQLEHIPSTSAHPINLRTAHQLKHSPPT